MNKQPTLSIIIPVYNEKETVEETIKIALEETGDNILNVKITKQLIIVDDGSFDGSSEIIDKFKHLPNVKIIHKKNGGKGSALKAAIPYCIGKFTIPLDADREYLSEEFPIMLYPASMGFKAIFGSRRMNPYNEGNQKSSLSFYLGGNALTWLGNKLYGLVLSDFWTGFKCIETNLLKELNLQCDGFEICAETIAKLAKRKIPIFEVPITFIPRKVQEGKKIRWTDGIKLAKELIKHKLK